MYPKEDIIDLENTQEESRNSIASKSSTLIEIEETNNSNSIPACDTNGGEIGMLKNIIRTCIGSNNTIIIK